MKMTVTVWSLILTLLPVLAQSGQVFQFDPEDPGYIRINKYMESITVPIIDFKDASVIDVLKYLLEDQAEKIGGHAIGWSINFKTHGALTTNQLNRTTNDSSIDEFGNGTYFPTPLVKLTVKLRNIKLSEAIKYICLITGLAYRIENLGGLTFFPEDAARDQMEQRMYHISTNAALIFKSLPGSILSNGPQHQIVFDRTNSTLILQDRREALQEFEPWLKEMKIIH